MHVLYHVGKAPQASALPHKNWQTTITVVWREHIATINPSEPRILSGCTFEANPLIRIPFEFPYEGFGDIYTKETLQQMNTPI
eukprot:13442867-Ditylum_brightwellii.AAC.1